MKPKLSDAEKTEAYMLALEHPLKDEINTVRNLIKNASPKIAERIKWNAPSYYYKEDLVTFNHRNRSRVHLVFHHIAIVKDKSPLLEGDYKDRRMMYFNSIDDIRAKEKELNRIIKGLVKEMDAL
ncbi:MAG TPA: DUF1801 domain-containing protein [Chitinophagaceae bacterium]|nr:DUF1801 domain-containing protein [Chitinophagaceae bacterium]